MLALVDLDRMQIVAVGGRMLWGECLRCGQCCRLVHGGRGCEHLAVERVDDRDRWYCGVYFDRPARCALWPQPQDPRPEGCGWSWED